MYITPSSISSKLTFCDVPAAVIFMLSQRLRSKFTHNSELFYCFVKVELTIQCNVQAQIFSLPVQLANSKRKIIIALGFITSVSFKASA